MWVEVKSSSFVLSVFNKNDGLQIIKSAQQKAPNLLNSLMVEG